MANILPENETVTFEEQTYVNPETSLAEQNAFIDNLRASQARQNAEIQQQTQDLGTNVPSNLGGLVGGEGYFTSRYQTPQTNALVGQLRSAAQAQALSQVLENEQAMWKNRYNEAYRAAKKRARSGGGGSPTTTTPTDPNDTGGLGIDSNQSGGNDTQITTYDPNIGDIVVDNGSYWQDPSTGQWYSLQSPREIDVYNVSSGLYGRYGQRPADGTVQSVNGRELMYNAQTDSWYERTPSMGPNGG